MNKAFDFFEWYNLPSMDSPINRANLMKINYGLEEIDNRVISMDTTKLNKVDAQTLVKSIEYNQANGVFTITYFNGATATIDTILEKLAINFGFNPANQQLVITLDDGTEQYVDLSALITQYEFLDSDTIAFALSSDGKISAIVKEGSIQEKHLQPNYLADIKVEVAKAQSSATAAATSETNAKASETATKASEDAAKQSEDNAAESATAADGSATTAMQKATDAADSANTATAKADEAAASALTASTKADEADIFAAAAAGSANTATQKAEAAADSASDADIYAQKSQSYAVGGTGAREGEDADCAQYYYEQSKRISQGINGIIPMGTITFEELSDPNNQQAGYFFNVSDSFVSDERFKDGAGIFYGAGNNVLYTADGMWDVTAASMVSGVKGAEETEYRQGFVNISCEDVGALPVDGDAKDAIVTFESGDNANPTNWIDIALFTTKEKLSSLIRKASLMSSNLRYLFKLIGSTSLSGIGDGTVTGAINALNTGLAFGGRTYATYNPTSPRLATKHIALPDAYKNFDVNNFFVVLEVESEEVAAFTTHFVEKQTGAFNVYFRNYSGADMDINTAIWFSYIVVVRAR